ncbi:MAG: hypothetical protein Q8R83_10105 [Legionellaceae bacterium]|nr:hypothetical protein [Legionellaceae bacterium]
MTAPSVEADLLTTSASQLQNLLEINDDTYIKSYVLHIFTRQAEKMRTNNELDKALRLYTKILEQAEGNTEEIKCAVLLGRGQLRHALFIKELSGTALAASSSYFKSSKKNFYYSAALEDYQQALALGANKTLVTELIYKLNDDNARVFINDTKFSVFRGEYK